MSRLRILSIILYEWGAKLPFTDISSEVKYFSEYAQYDKPNDRFYLDRYWLKNMRITIAFPHSIADGDSERLLRLLYGERFQHSIKRRIIHLKNLLYLTEQITEK